MVTLSAQGVRHERRRRRHAIQYVVYSVDRHSGAVCRRWCWLNYLEFDSMRPIELDDYLMEIDSVLFPFCVWYFVIYAAWSLV